MISVSSLQIKTSSSASQSDASSWSEETTWKVRAGPHLDHRAVDGDELDFVVVTGNRRRRAADQNRKHDRAYQRPHLTTANQTIHAEIIRAES